MTPEEETGRKVRLPGNEHGWEWHLEELRRRVVTVLIVFAAASAAAFACSGKIAEFLTLPLAELAVSLYTFAPAEKFLAYMRVSLCAGAVVAAPFACLQAALFIWPGLRGRERSCAAFSLSAAPALFVAGAATAYRFLAPAVLRFFLSFASGDGVSPLWGVGDYLSLLLSLAVACGLLLQLPLLMLILFAAGIVSPQRASHTRPYIVLFLFTLAALATPPDVVSQVALGVPLWLLFELTLALGRIIRR